MINHGLGRDRCQILLLILFEFKRQPHKMVKQTRTTSRFLPANCLSVFDHFVRLAFKRLGKLIITPSEIVRKPNVL